MSELDRLIGIVERLRAEDGCPWDRAQTHETLKAPCIEEAAEVICGINILTETGSAENLQEELGDLLFQVLFHASLAKDEGLFTLEDVARTAAPARIRGGCVPLRRGEGRRVGGDQKSGESRARVAGAVSCGGDGRGEGIDRCCREAERIPPGG